MNGPFGLLWKSWFRSQNTVALTVQMRSEIHCSRGGWCAGKVRLGLCGGLPGEQWTRAR